MLRETTLVDGKAKAAVNDYLVMFIFERESKHQPE